MKHHPNNTSGFSLVEMALVIAVLGIITGSVLALTASSKENSNLRELEAKMEVIDAAIKGYITKYEALPCPASRTAAENTTLFGRSTDCSAAAPAGTADTGSGTDAIRIGMLPNRSLMLPDSYAFDPWGNRFTFVIVKEMGKSSSTLNTYQTSLSNGVINITDINGNQVTESAVDSIVAYLVISHGGDKKGAYAKNGAISNACGSTAKDSENCDGDITFIDADITQTADPANANFFYDKLHWRLLSQLIGTVEADDSIKQYSVDNNIACITRAKGAAYCIGLNATGQLGNGNTTTSAMYTQVGGSLGATDWKSVQVDGDTTCGLKGLDEMYCWGANAYGQVGDNTTAGPRLNPTAVIPETGANSGWTEYDVDSEHACGIRGGSILCWGRNDLGQLGDGTTTNRNRPRQAGAQIDWTSVTTGYKHSCGLRNSRIYCWGDNQYGQLGTNNTTQVLNTTTQENRGYTNWTMVASNHNHTCAIRGTGELWCWGRNQVGQLGINNTTNALQATQVLATGGGAGWTDWSTVALGNTATCGIRTSGEAYCWGDDTYGQIGNGATTGVQRTPVLVNGGYTDWTSIDVGKTVCGLRSGKDAFYCWGENDVGQVGDGSATNPITAPVLVTAY